MPALILLAAYLIGAIPFAFVLVKARKGIDVRTVGSGNVGATNAARVLGLRYFFVIFVLDGLKGYLPTALLPRLDPGSPSLPVFVALATIVGHNYPVYLGFRGGKGVATSLGAMLALDWVASLATVGVAVAVLLGWRYVSAASMAGALTFAAVHFARVNRPWSAENRAMSGVTIALVALLLFRHRSNVARLLAGTEPKVTLRRTRPETNSQGGNDAGDDGAAEA